MNPYTRSVDPDTMRARFHHPTPLELDLAAREVEYQRTNYKRGLPVDAGKLFDAFDLFATEMVARGAGDDDIDDPDATDED